MHRRRCARSVAAVSAAAVLAGCSSSGPTVTTPGLDPRGTVLTTVQPKRQDLVNRISLTGKVTIDPVFGLVAPSDGEVRYVQRQPSATPATRPIWVATVWDGQEPHQVRIPKDSTLTGRLTADRASVTAGMPIVSARHSGYGIVADIDSTQAYRISGALTSVRGQITNGPGPFPCAALGTIAALPAGTIPAPPVSTASAQPSAQPTAPDADTGSEPTGMRLVCTAPDGTKLINGAAVTLDVATAKATHVLVLPVEAIAGVQGRGKVDVVGADHQRKTVDVVLGLTDGKVVEIRSGLTGNETVAVPGPNLPTAAPGGQGPGGQPSGGPG